jgi:hypothetical protein
MKFFLFFLLIMSLTFTSANGLNVINGDQVINKTIDQNVNFIFSIKNEEPLIFYNVSIESNPYITMTKIPVINAGETFNVTGTIIKDAMNEKMNLKIKGVYLNDVGIKNETKNVSLNWDMQSDCNFALTKGDTINFTNTGNYEIGLVTNFGTENILSKTSFLQKYDSEGSFWFKRKVGALQFETCTITVLPISGYVNNPLFDAILNITIASKYEATNLSVNILTSNYTIGINSQEEGVILITNGAKIAKNVSFQGEWFTFGQNYIDIEPGYTKTITYTINPIISNTNDTGKTYDKTVSIKGNFPDMNMVFKIAIPYSVITPTNTSINNMTMKDMLCSLYPELCEPQIIYRDFVNGSDGLTNVTISAEMWRDYNLELYKQREELKTALNFIKENDQNKTESINNLNGKVEELADSSLKATKDNEKSSSAVVSFLLVLLLSAVIGITFYLVKYYKIKNKITMEASWK